VSKEKMDVPKVLEALNEALRLQRRSALQYAHIAGSMRGFELQTLTDQLNDNAKEELGDVRRLTEKITALGGDPTTSSAQLRHPASPTEAFEWLIESETEAIDSLARVIPPSGQEGRSEALEHLMEHMILRKQNQVDLLLRALP
jgi:bacterioferritin